MNRFCEQCGAKLEPDENFCPSCGARTEDEEPPQPSPPPPPPPQTNDDNKFIKWGALGLVVVAFCFFVYQQKHQEKERTWTYTPPTAATSETKISTPSAIDELDFKIGSLALGLQRNEVEKIYGAGKVQSDGWYSYDDFWAKFDSNNRISWISCMSPNLYTTRGICVGLPLSDLEKFYDMNQFQKQTTDKYIRYEYKLQDNVLIFSVLKSSNKVDEIVLIKDVDEPKKTAPAASNEEDLMISNGVVLGMSKAQVENKIGVCEPIDGVGRAFRRGDFELSFSEKSGKLELLFCSDSKINTARGIHVGSTLADIERSYGKADSFDEPENGEDLQYYYPFEKGIIVFYVDKYSSRVNKFAMAMKAKYL